MTTKRDDLQLLSLFHYGYAAVAGLFSLLPLVYAGFGAFLLLGGFDHAKGTTPPREMGVFLVIIGLAASFFLVLYAVGLGFAGYFLSRNRRRTFILVIDAISCLFGPYGIVLGVISLIVLMKPAVKESFEGPTLLPM